MIFSAITDRVTNRLGLAPHEIFASFENFAGALTAFVDTLAEKLSRFFTRVGRNQERGNHADADPDQKKEQFVVFHACLPFALLHFLTFSLAPSAETRSDGDRKLFR